MATNVFNLNTGNYFPYDLPPAEAVNAAYEQFTKKNMNTWTYPNAADVVSYGPSNKTVSRGDFCAII